MTITAHRVEPARLRWQDGEPYSEQFGDIYYSRGDGLDESRYVFLGNNRIPERWLGKPHFCVGELGFGTGLNFFLTAKCWRQTRKPGQRLHYISIERYPLTAADLKLAAGRWPELVDEVDRLLGLYPTLVAGVHHIDLGDGIELILVFADVAEGLAEIDASIDAWYLDGFNPQSNQSMWSQETFLAMAQLTNQGGTLSTFSVAGFVRRGLECAGFQWRKVAGHGRKREMLIATFAGGGSSPTHAPWFTRSATHYSTGQALVIGAGIAGCSTAYALKRAGWRVTVLDQGSGLANGASGTPAGLVYPVINAQPNNYERFFQRAFGCFLRTLKRLAVDDSVWRQTGVAHRVDRRHFDQVRSRLDRESGLREWVRCEAEGELFYPAGGILVPRSLCDALVRDVDLVSGFQARNLDVSGEGLMVSGHDGRRFAADVVVVAAGFESGGLLPENSVPIQPRSGQVEVVGSEAVGSMSVPIMNDGYVIPLNEQTTVVGASFTPGSIDGDKQSQWREENLERLRELAACRLPDAIQSIHSVAGTRATTADRLPMLGPVVDEAWFLRAYADLCHGRPERNYSAAHYRRGVFVNIGYGSRGLLGAMLGARIVLSEIQHEPWPLEKSLREFLLPQRFLVRNLRKGLI